MVLSNIEIDHLQKVIDGRLVLDIPSLNVGAGEIVALVGALDSGKDHLLDLILGKTPPTLGSLKLAGLAPLSDKRRLRRQLGVMFASDDHYPRQSVKANLVFYCRLHGLPASRAGEVLALVGLSDHAEVKAGKLSPPLSCRLAFGRAILHQPQLLILEEPFERCDTASVALISRLLQEFSDQGGTVLLLAQSDIHLMTLCDVIYTLEQGRITATRRPGEDPKSDLPFKIPVRLEGKVILVNPADILYAVAEESGTFLHTSQSQYPISLTLSDLEERLSRSGFFRAHRGYLVNLQHVKEVIQFTRNSYNLRLDDPLQTEIPLSKTAAGELGKLLGF
jgi:ABC-2 type transport system ATP-binding protein